MSILLGKIVIKSNKKKYIKIKRNQLLILDSLLNDGGKRKKYIDRTSNIRYSEHSGNIGIKGMSIDRIIVSGLTNREDSDDNEILLPNNLVDSYDYKYFFHTHPPTPLPGSRSKFGILYEFPSIADIFHFIDHYNMGNTIGSIVVAPEGYYIIYPSDFKLKKIKYDLEIEDEIYEKMNEENIKIQEQAIKKYGTDMTEDYYYTNVVPNKRYLKMFNRMVNKYLDNQIKIIIKIRTKDSLTNKWILKHLYLPI